MIDLTAIVSAFYSDAANCGTAAAHRMAVASIREVMKETIEEGITPITVGLTATVRAFKDQVSA